MSGATGPGQTSSSTAPADMDAISRFKVQIPHMKALLTNLLRVAGENVHFNTLRDSGSASGAAPPEKIEKNLEDFYAACDSMETTLSLALTHSRQASNSQQHANGPIAAEGAGVNVGRAAQYTAYTQQARKQIETQKELVRLVKNAPAAGSRSSI